MVTLLVVSCSVVAACAGLAAAIFDARRQTWRMALYGGAAFLLAMLVLAGVLMNSLSGSIWHAVALLPLVASFAVLYLVTRLIAFALRAR